MIQIVQGHLWNISSENYYNMDQKKFAMSFLDMFHVICSKHEKDIAIAKAQNWEWTTLIKYIFSDGFLLLS